MANVKKIREPLFQVSKRTNIPMWKGLLIRVGAILIGLVFCMLLCAIIFKANPFAVLGELFSGNFGSERRIWFVLRDTFLLLGVGLALTPAFRMKFWNLGGNGQILMGCLAAIGCMFNLGGKMPDAVVWLIMIVTSILAGIVWAVIPAIFKAFFNTNESLFTLMMNYIAVGLVSYCISKWAKNGSGTMGLVSKANFPEIVNQYLLPIIVIALLTVFLYIYTKHSKHGFEVDVVGDSTNTAKYIGINVKKVIIRTLALSGAICGIVGLLIAGSIDHTISEASAKNMGFTAIMVAWLAKFNPLTMIATSFLISFLSRGMAQVQTAFGITNNSVSNIIIGIIYFCVIGCEFFISYKLKIRKRKKASLNAGNDFISSDSVVNEERSSNIIKEEN